MKYSYKIVKESFHSEEPWVNVFILRYITLPLVYLMVNFTKITPNIISLLSVSFGICAAYFYATSSIYLGAISYFISYIFDATDGKVARITKTGKIYGAWMDICIDRVNLVIITTAIAYNSYLIDDTIYVILLNNIFLGLAFIGWESRYNIDYYKLKVGKNQNLLTNLSKYDKWCKVKGVIKAPISLPELFLFYLIIAPLINLELISIVILIFFLLIRIIAQQKFWKSELKAKS